MINEQINYFQYNNSDRIEPVAETTIILFDNVRVYSNLCVDRGLDKIDKFADNAVR